MPETLTACPLCKDPQSTLFDQRDFRGYPVTNRLCSNCGLVYQTPRMTETELNEFYQSEYRLVYQGDEEPEQKDLKVQRARADAIVEYLRDWGINQVGRYLDIGSSTGILLGKIKEEYECQVVGIEPGEAYREYAHKRGLEVYGTLEEMEEGIRGKYDLISMIHVLEHLPDPVGYLDNLSNNYLTEKGKVLIEVPNLYAHDCFEIAHLTSFSRHTLVEVMKSAGFKTISLEPHGRPRSNMIPLYISLLAEPGSIETDKVEKEQWIGWKRNAGMAHRRVIQRLFPRQAWLPEFRS